jgi:hypothetical protein
MSVLPERYWLLNPHRCLAVLAAFTQNWVAPVVYVTVVEGVMVIPACTGMPSGEVTEKLSGAEWLEVLEPLAREKDWEDGTSLSFVEQAGTVTDLIRGCLIRLSPATAGSISGRGLVG